MKRSLPGLMTLAIACVLLASPIAHAQTATASLTGTVVDKDGGVIPGATVVVKNNDTGVTFNAISNATGAFAVPALNAGTYTVTVSLSGFKTAVIKDVKVAASTQADIRATLEIGNLTETVTVQGRSDLIQTQSPTIATTISVDQVSKLPGATRNVLNYVTFLPGVDTSTTNRNSTVMGLPQSTLAITLDGMTIQDNFLKTTDGFYARVTPRQDAIEEVTVSGATPGADAAGQGAVQIKFVTRSGSNQYTGSAYEYFRHASLNSNYFFNKINGLPRNRITLNQYGGREGGPIVIPRLYDGHGKAFFFLNHEEFRQPTSITRTRVILNPLAQQGIFQYNVTSGGVTTTVPVDLLALAGRNNQLTSTDPLVMEILGRIRAATGTTGVIRNRTDPNLLDFIYQAPSQGVQHQPTVRVDYNLTPKHRLSGSHTQLRLNSNPDILNSEDPTFPGFKNQGPQISNRFTGQVTLRSTFTSTLVNEFQYGGTWGPTFFSPTINPSQFTDQAGYSLSFPQFSGTGNTLTSATTDRAPSARSAYSWNFIDTLNYLKGKHNFTFGAQFTQVSVWLWNQTMVPQIQFGVDTNNDPAAGMFNNTNFPGSSTNDLGNARLLYALLTGRVTAINGDARINDATGQYEYLGQSNQRGRLNEYGIYGQDSWRLTPTVTLNAGLRWELQLPFKPLNSLYSSVTFADLCGISGTGAGPDGRNCNLFKPGTLAGVVPTYKQYTGGSPGYNTDWNNFAPNVGIAWRPNVQNGWLRRVLGDPEQATVRAGYSVAYSRQGMTDFTTIYGGNPGISISANRNNTNQNLVNPGETWPLLLRDRTRLARPATCSGVVSAACVPPTPTYPIAANVSNNLNLFDPDLQVAFARSYTIGLQRSLSREMAVEIRYVGTRNTGGWTTENWNEINVYENGFLNEFKLAQTNLLANIAAGRGNTFAFTGAPGTSPLPIFLAHYNMSSAAADPTKYTGNNWTNGTYLGWLSLYNPNPGGFASTNSTNGLYGNSTFRNNGRTAGLAPNFWVMNPDVGNANIRRSASYTKYDSLQIEMRRRLSNGLLMSANYTYAQRWTSALDSVRYGRYLVTDTAGVPHAFKMTWTYDIPVGQGKRFGANLNPWLNGVLGGWAFDGTGRVQSGRMLSMSGVQLVGMTEADLRSMYKIRFDADAKIVYILPQDVVENTRRAFNTDPTSATGYSSLGVPTGRYIAPAGGPTCVEWLAGECGEPKNIYVQGPIAGRVDVSMKKTFPLGGRRSFQLQVDALNIFDNINFTPVANPGSSATIFQVSAAYQDVSNTYDPGGRLGQIVLRINW